MKGAAARSVAMYRVSMQALETVAMLRPKGDISNLDEGLCAWQSSSGDLQTS